MYTEMAFLPLGPADGGIIRGVALAKSDAALPKGKNPHF
jgi:hypothetical protein